jgi:hypothetical protein
MNWVYVGLSLAIIYLAWFTFIISKKKYDKYLLIVGLAHIPYLLVNLVAPFRGAFDANYAGYSFGWIVIPAEGPWVTLVIGFIVISSLIIASKAILNDMNKLWLWAFAFDLMLSVMIAFPVLLEVVTNPLEFTIELGEYLTISGFAVALLVFVLFSGPTFFSTLYLGKKVKRTW